MSEEDETKVLMAEQIELDNCWEDNLWGSEYVIV